MTRRKTWPIRTDRRGGIEGLPLELLVVLVVATVGTAILIGWMGDLQDSKIESYGDIDADISLLKWDGSRFSAEMSDGTVKDFGPEFDICIHVINNDGDGIGGAIVTVSGLGVTGETAMHTDALGDCTFDGLKLKTNIGSDIAFLTFHIWSEKLGDTELKVPVVKA